MPNQLTQRSTTCPDVRLNRYNSRTRNTDRLRAGHVPPKPAVTFRRNRRSRSTEITGHVRRNTHNFTPLREFHSLVQANEALRAWILGEAGNRIHGTTRERPLKLFAQT